MDKWISTGLVVALVAVIALLGFPAIRHLRETPSPPDPPIRLSFPVPPDTVLGSGDDILDAAISPDQTEIVFVATTGGATRLWRRFISADQPELIRGSIGAQFPAFKQTGKVIAFFASSRLKLHTLGRNTSTDVGTATAPSGACWLLDGSLLFAPDARGPIRRLLDGSVSDATKLRGGDRSHTFPMTVGSSNAFVYIATLSDGRRMVRLVENGQEHDLVTTSGHAQLIGNTLLHVRDGVLLMQRLHTETRQPTGASEPLVLDVGTAAAGHSFFSASERLVITAPQAKRLRQLAWYSLADGTGVPTREPGDYWQVRLSPDDRYAAVTQATPLLRTLDVVLMPTQETGTVEPLTRAVAADGDPVWSPDARTLAFRSLQDGQPHLYTHAAHDQDASDQIVPRSEADETPTDWHGDQLFVHAPGAKGDFNLWSVTVSSGARESLVSGEFNETDARLSPDGRWMAYVSEESGQADVYAVPRPDGARVRVSSAGGTRPRWSRDGRSLFFLRGSRIMRAHLSGSAFTIARAVLDVPGIRDFDVAHRRDAVLAVMPAAGSTSPAASVMVDWNSSADLPR